MGSGSSRSTSPSTNSEITAALTSSKGTRRVGPTLGTSTPRAGTTTAGSASTAITIRPGGLAQVGVVALIDLLCVQQWTSDVTSYRRYVTSLDRTSVLPRRAKS